jgi:hypothetical protein
MSTVEAILDGRQPADVQLDDLLAGFPLAWVEQKKLVSHAESATD